MEMPETPVPKYSTGTRMPRTLAAPGEVSPDTSAHHAAHASLSGLSQDAAVLSRLRFAAWEPPIREDESSWDSI